MSEPSPTTSDLTHVTTLPIRPYDNIDAQMRKPFQRMMQTLHDLIFAHKRRYEEGRIWGDDFAPDLSHEAVDDGCPADDESWLPEQWLVMPFWLSGAMKLPDRTSIGIGRGNGHWHIVLDEDVSDELRSRSAAELNEIVVRLERYR